MSKLFHLKLKKSMLKGATVALLPGDPQRAEKIAQYYDPNARLLSYNREFASWLGHLDKTLPVLTASTGIGGPSTAIVIEELAQLGINTFIRVGTSGAIQKRICLQDIIITTASVRLDGTSTHYTPIAYPAVADHDITHSLILAAKSLKIPYHAGITASSDSFFPGQERYETFSGYIIKKFQGSLNEWQKLNVLNYEMESATLLCICNAFALRAGCLTTAIVNRALNEKLPPRPEMILQAEDNMIKVAIGALRKLFPQK